MGLLSWIAVGSAVGLLARLATPGSFAIAVLVGIAGASFGGFVVGMLGVAGSVGFSVWSIPAAALGAAALLSLYELISRRTA